MIVFDRILNKEISISEIESPIVLGRYLFTTADSKAQLNDSIIEKDDFLVPSKPKEALLKNDKEITKIAFQDNELLNENIDSLVKQSLLDSANDLKTTEDLLALKDVNILLRNFDKRLKITEMESLLQKKLFHLEEVCREPSYHLKREVTKQNVSRAKRIPVKAINYLAAHTEDWSRRRIRSVEPRRILAETIDYNLEIYENQLTASLIDKLLIFFSNRMNNDIDVIESFISKIEIVIASRNNSKENIFWYKKLDKDYKKLAKAIHSIEKNRKEIDNIKSFISALQMRLLGLLKSDLYIANSRSKNIASLKIKRTNLFDNHQHYRFIKILWEKFHLKKEVSLSQKSKKNQKVVQSYIDYSLVLIFRSLFQIGFNEIEKLNESNFKLKNKNIPHIKIELIKDNHQIISLYLNSEITLSFTPTPSTKNTDEMYPKEKKDKYYFSISGSETRNDILEITPTEINSEERITKIIFQSVLKLFTSNYFYSLNSQSISEFKILNTWLKEQETLILDKGQNRKTDFWLKRKLNTYELKELESIINKQKKELSAKTDIRQKETTKLNEIENKLKHEARKHFETYETCIRCATKNHNHLKSNYNGGFSFKCTNKDCEVNYGFTEKDIFYLVPKHEEIKTNLSKFNKEINESLILNAFGFENI